MTMDPMTGMQGPGVDPMAMQNYQLETQAYMAAQHQQQVTKDAALIMERGLAYGISEYGFDETIKQVCQDYLLTGRGVPRIKYTPTFKNTPVVPAPLDPMALPMEGQEPPPPAYLHSETNEPVDPAEIQGLEEGSPYIVETEWEQVECELVHWDDFRVSPAKCWRDVRVLFYRDRLTREELVKQFGPKGEAVPLTGDDDDDDKDNKADKASKGVLKRAEVWQAWDKDTRTVTFFTGTDRDEKGQALSNNGVLATVPDPLGLKDFFPSPRPLYSIPSTDNLVPLPEYLMYEDQARELNRVTERINKLLPALKYRGIATGGEGAGDVKKLLKADDNEIIVSENFAVMENGLAKSLLILPLDEPIAAITQLYLARDQIKQVIYEITGLADIIRGATDPNETLGAQQLKAQWGSLRIQDRRREVERLVVDLFRMKAEIMATKFDAATLEAMSGVPVSDEIMAFLQDDGLRNYRIDVETDSMIAADNAKDQEQVTKLLAGVVEFTQGIAPAVQSGILPLGAAKAMLLAAVRRFPAMGREVEDALNQIPDEMPAGLSPPAPGAPAGQPSSPPAGGGAPTQQQQALPPPGMLQ